jgi:carbon storage regulator
MLVLNRKGGESIYIGSDIRIVIIRTRLHDVRVGIEAPPELKVLREEIAGELFEQSHTTSTFRVGEGSHR